MSTLLNLYNHLLPAFLLRQCLLFPRSPFCRIQSKNSDLFVEEKRRKYTSSTQSTTKIHYGGLGMAENFSISTKGPPQAKAGIVSLGTRE